jgi:hypothetical protein
MGAKTGNRSQMDAARQQQAMEGQEMRRRAAQEQGQFAPTQEERVTPEMPSPVPQVPMGYGSKMGRGPKMGYGSEMGRTVGMGGMPEMRSGINFGPGRANRIPEQGSPEYEQLLQRVRGLNQGQR